MGKKEEPEGSGVRRGAVGAEDRARGFNAARGSGERYKLLKRARAEPGRQTTFGAFLV